MNSLKIGLIYFLLSLFFSLFAEKTKLLAFENNGLYGFKNKKGTIVIQPQYEMAFDFTNESVAFVFKKDRWKCINLKNQDLLEPYVFDNGPDAFSEGLARFIENQKIGFYRKGCKKTIPPVYDFALPFEKGYAQVCSGCQSFGEEEHLKMLGGKYGAIDKIGNIVLPIEYDGIISMDYIRKIALVKKRNLKIEVRLKHK